MLKYEDMIDMLVDANDNTAHNQASAVSYIVRKAKQEFLNSIGKTNIDFTVDSPIPYEIFGTAESISTDEITGEIVGDVSGLLAALKKLNIGRVKGSTATGKNGPYNGQFDRLIPRLENKTDDRRLSFMFSNNPDLRKYSYLGELCHLLMSAQDGSRVKIVNLSEVPSDVLPLVTSLLARIIFETQLWTQKNDRHPVAIFCDEAHLYIQNRNETGIEKSSLKLFERISKEGRKYGVGLVIISQRPSEVNRTVLSQCNNFIAMRLNNPDDQNIIRRLFPDSLQGFSEILPNLDVGEALVVGDSVLLPTRIRIDEPKKGNQPKSSTIDFWSIWGDEEMTTDLNKSIESWRKQSII